MRVSILILAGLGLASTLFGLAEAKPNGSPLQELWKENQTLLAKIEALEKENLSLLGENQRLTEELELLRERSARMKNWLTIMIIISIALAILISVSFYQLRGKTI